MKIGGARVFPAEIAALLLELPLVRRAVVFATNSAQEQVLVAVIVPRNLAEAAPNDIRRELAKIAPRYCVPATIVLVDELPTLSNGKVDLEAAKRLCRYESTPGHVDCVPSEVQRRLALIWEELLGVGVLSTSNFFQMGGHSMLALRAITAMNAHFNVDVPLDLMFEEHSVASIAAWIEEHQQ